MKYLNKFKNIFFLIIFTYFFSFTNINFSTLEVSFFNDIYAKSEESKNKKEKKGTKNNQKSENKKEEKSSSQNIKV